MNRRLRRSVQILGMITIPIWGPLLVVGIGIALIWLFGFTIIAVFVVWSLNAFARAVNAMVRSIDRTLTGRSGAGSDPPQRADRPR